MYCPSCDQDTPTETSVEGGYILDSCTLCGLGLGIRVSDELGGTSPAASGGALAKVGVVRKAMTLVPAIERPTPFDPRSGQSLPTPAPEVSRPVGKMERVFLVEDAELLRQITADLLRERGLAETIVECADGAIFIEQYAAALARGEPADLIILDVRMPGLDGHQAGVALRAIEAGFQVPRAPLLFFSSVLCDEPFKALLRQLGARYIRKSEGSDHALGDRLLAVLERLIAGEPSGEISAP